MQIGVRLWVARGTGSNRIITHLKAEAASIWAPYGVHLAWIDGDTAVAHPMVINVTLEREPESQRADTTRAVLGKVLVAPDDPGPYPVHVSYDATREMLVQRTGPGRVSIPEMVPDGELARALGRVVAHEIGHVLIGTTYHDHSGLMRPNFSADMLASPNRSPFRLTAETLRKLRGGYAVRTAETASAGVHLAR